MNTLHRRAKIAIVICAFLFVIGLLPSGTHAEKVKTVDQLYTNQQNQKELQPSNSTEESELLSDTSSPSGWSFLLQVIFSLGLIILLIYLLLRFLANKQLHGNGRSGPFKVVGVTPLGNGKSLCLIMVGESLYLIGVGDNVQLIRQIPSGEEMDMILTDAEIRQGAMNFLGEWITKIRQKREEQLLINQGRTDQNFDELLNNHWGQVGAKADLWEEDNGNKGEKR